MILKKLIIKYLYNEANALELTLLKDWLKKDRHKEKFKSYVRIHYLLNKSNVSLINDEAFENIINKISKNNSPKKSKRPLLDRDWVRYSVAASVILLISIGLFYKQNNIDENNPIIINNSIEIGTDRAILTLDDGTNIILDKDNAYLTNNVVSNGENITYKPSDASEPKTTYNYLTVPPGGQYQMTLMDGTKVWLNSESKLKYPTNFVQDIPRKVELIYGEAFFDVSPSPNHKGKNFKVIHNLQTIEVLGTEFNIKAYQDEDQIYTTLVEGIVNISNTITHATLLPRQQSILAKQDNTLRILNDVDTYSETSWTRGAFNFKDMELEKIMKVLSRWYVMDVIFLNKTLRSEKYTGVLGKEQSIEDILYTISNTSSLSYKIDHKTVILK